MLILKKKKKKTQGKEQNLKLKEKRKIVGYTHNGIYEEGYDKQAQISREWLHWRK